jgi:hypothetical protein
MPGRTRRSVLYCCDCDWMYRRWSRDVDTGGNPSSCVARRGSSLDIRQRFCMWWNQRYEIFPVGERSNEPQGPPKPCPSDAAIRPHSDADRSRESEGCRRSWPPNGRPPTSARQHRHSPTRLHGGLFRLRSEHKPIGPACAVKRLRHSFAAPIVPTSHHRPPPPPPPPPQ